MLPNANGTAPGLWIEHGDRVVVLLPGPPREMQPIVERVRAAAGRAHAVSAGAAAARPEDAGRPSRRSRGRAAASTHDGGLADARRDDHPGVARADRAAPVGARRRRARARCSVLDEAVGGACGGAWRRRVQHDGRALAEVVGGLLAGTRPAHRGRPSRARAGWCRAADGRAGSSAWVIGGVVAYANDVKTRPAWACPRRSDRGARRRQRAGGAAMAGGVRERLRTESGSASRELPGRAAAPRPSRSAPSRSRRMAGGGCARTIAQAVRTFKFLGDREMVRASGRARRRSNGAAGV